MPNQSSQDDESDRERCGLISEKEYCSRVCGAKCCIVHSEHVRCPKLGEDNLCSIYSKRFSKDSPETVIVGWFRSTRDKHMGEPELKPIVCGRIRDIIKRKRLPQAIEEQCCIAHPELLKRKYEL